MAGYVVLRTHGGLGNQLFQVLLGRLFAEREGRTLLEVHDTRYRHAFVRSSALERGHSPSRWQLIVSAARVPKLLQRVLGLGEAPWRLGQTVYLDGYFQRADLYSSFSAEKISNQLQRLADELTIGRADVETCLVHLRVGDFFSDRAMAKAHVLERLQHIPAGARVMTNEESLLGEPEVVRAMAERDASLISTNGMSAEEVLRTMARHQRIDANDSTLTFWAAVLGGSQVGLRNDRLRACRDLLVQHRLAHEA